MNYYDKTKEELITELLNLQKENRDLKHFNEKNISTETSSEKNYTSEIEIQNNFSVLNSLFESLQNVIIFSLDTNYCYKSFTISHKQTMKQIWGVDIEIGMNMLEQIHDPDDFQKAKDNFDLVLKGQHLTFEEEYGDSKLYRTYYENIYNPIIESNGVVVKLSVFVIDITERKNTEKAQRDSEARFRSYFELPLIGITITSPEKGWIEVNEGVVAMLGYSREELSVLTWAELTHPDDLPADEEQFNRVLSDQQDTYFLEKRFICKNGEIIWTNLSAGCVRNSDRTVDYMVALLQNITERKLAEDDLRINEERYRLLAENSRDVIWTMKLDGTITYISPAVEQLRGFTVEEAMHQPIDKILTPDSQAIVIEYLQKLNADYASGLPLDSFRGENEYYCKDGSTLWTEVIVYPLPSSESNSVTMLGVTRDISARKKAEEALRNSDEQIRLLLNSTAEAIYGIDLKGNCTFCNSACVRQLGYNSPADLLGYNMHDKIHYKHANGKFFNVETCSIFKAFKTGESVHVDTEVLWCANGSSFPAEYWSYPQYHDGKIVGAVVTFLDITERKRAEEALVQSEEKFRSLYSNMVDGSALHTLVFDEQGVPEDYIINDVNPAFETLLGLSRENVINKTSKEVYGVDEPPYFEIYSRVALTGKPEVFEAYFTPLDSYFSISVYCPKMGSFATIFENITERRKAEYEKERTQKLLEDSQRIGKIGGWEINLDTRELKWTKEMYHIHELDLSFTPIIDQRFSFYTPESLPALDEAVQKAIKEGGSYEIDSEIITAKGNLRSVKSIGKADLENRRVFGLFQDITERKRTEQELKRSEHELKIAQQITHIGSFYIDLTTNKVTWTEELYKMYGFDSSLPPPLLNESQNLFTPESWELLSASIANTVQTGVPYEIELTTNRKGGGNGWMWARGEAIKNKEGKVTEIWGVVQDITERKRAEIELNETNSYLENLINYANAPIIVWDPQFRITRFNHAFEFITGYTESEVLGKPLEILFPPGLIETSMGLIHKTITGERWKTVEIQIQHRDKSSRILLWNSATLFTSDGKIPVATIAQGQDITDRKLAELALQNSEDKLRELNATKDKFFSIIAHDLKSPFSGIVGLSAILKDEARDLDIDSIVKYTEIINSSAMQTFSLLENLLDWAKTQQGGFQFKPKKLFINDLISHEIIGLKFNADQKNIKLVNRTNEELIVTADEKMLGTVIRNLISNAIKFTPKDGLVTIDALLKNNQAVVSISDTGVGMDKGTIEKLFKIESSFTTRGTENEKGSGLGLLLCKEFVEKHDGKIWVESEFGKGSSFVFSIPL